jgi:alcohol oxidase
MAIQTETYQVEPSSLKNSTQDDAATHGYDGPLKVLDGGLFTSIGKEFLNVAAIFNKKCGQDDDPNALYSQLFAT